jgi:SAM-dependent methyltransferase
MTWHPDMPESYKNQIVTGDARVLAERIPDESVDLIFTDPVYDRIDDYRWLAETAARVLKPEGALLCWSNGKWHRDNADWLEKARMRYRWTFTVVTMDKSAPLNGKIICKANRVLWMDKGASRLIGYLPDGYATYSGADRNPLPTVRHRWHKSPQWTLLALRAFMSTVTLDPFCGSGTTLAACKHLSDRKWIGIEIDPISAALARFCVANTQPPLFVPEPEQLELAGIAEVANE